MKKFNFPNPFDYFKAGKEAIKDFSKEQKHAKQTKSETIVVQKNGYAELESSYTDESSQFLINPNTFNLALDLHPMYLNGGKLFIQAANDHNTLNITEISEIMSDVKYDADLFLLLTDEEKKEFLSIDNKGLQLLKNSYMVAINENFMPAINNTEFKNKLFQQFKDSKITMRLHIDNIHATINPNFWSNKFSYSFTIQAFKIIQTKILSFLEDAISRKIFIAAIIISILFGIIIGIVFGAAIMAFISGFMFYMIK